MNTFAEMHEVMSQCRALCDDSNNVGDIMGISRDEAIVMTEEALKSILHDSQELSLSRIAIDSEFEFLGLVRAHFLFNNLGRTSEHAMPIDSVRVQHIQDCLRFPFVLQQNTGLPFKNADKLSDKLQDFYFECRLMAFNPISISHEKNDENKRNYSTLIGRIEDTLRAATPYGEVVFSPLHGFPEIQIKFNGSKEKYEIPSNRWPTGYAAAMLSEAFPDTPEKLSTQIHARLQASKTSFSPRP